ncbi:hypothetical protein JZ751_004950 [Albula glossodonta]|uniref:Uncharacterized protein n=1 Tax=Albula glossodonta TaxID=121402 RepID=A0A8T2P1V3_9TELE|nr:hypothetical protein JZ751_004950 [Albula glossodonta]
MAPPLDLRCTQRPQKEALYGHPRFTLAEYSHGPKGYEIEEDKDSQRARERQRER